MQNIIVIGIHTEVGKTVASAIISQVLGGTYWKPIQCGEPSDATWVSEYLERPSISSRYFLKTPSSPHIAARNEGISIQSSDFRIPIVNTPLVIEGTGGIFAPLNEEEVWIDAAQKWKGHWILVHRHYLGSLNHCLLTLEALRLRRISLTGMIFNGTGDRDTEIMLLERAKAKCVGRLSQEPSLNRERLNEIGKEWEPLLHKTLGF